MTLEFIYLVGSTAILGFLTLIWGSETIFRSFTRIIIFAFFVIGLALILKNM